VVFTIRSIDALAARDLLTVGASSIPSPAYLVSLAFATRKNLAIAELQEIILRFLILSSYSTHNPPSSPASPCCRSDHLPARHLELSPD
jgi:hypothetical protein